MEYGGSYGSSRISDLSTNSVGLSHLHVLKVELDGHATLCEGVEMPPYTEVLMVNQCLNIHRLMYVPVYLQMIFHIFFFSITAF